MDLGPHYDFRLPTFVVQGHGRCQCLSEYRYDGKVTYTLRQLSDGHEFKLEQGELLRRSMYERIPSTIFGSEESPE